jgi:crotonobetainyl-CoA:carnitine CoA-transferase CaiB-like acyl-CoA transferase
VFETADAHVFIGCGADRMFQKLAAALGSSQLAQDPRFTRNADRVAHRDALHEAIATLTRAQTTQAVVDQLRAAGVPVSAVNDLAGLLQDPQVQSLALQQPMALASGATLSAVGTPIRIDGQRAFDGHLSPRVGQDTEAVLRAAGLSADEIASLAAQGAVQV